MAANSANSRMAVADTVSMDHLVSPILIFFVDPAHWAVSSFLSFTLTTCSSQYDWIFPVPSPRMRIRGLGPAVPCRYWLFHRLQTRCWASCIVSYDSHGRPSSVAIVSLNVE